MGNIHDQSHAEMRKQKFEHMFRNNYEQAQQTNHPIFGHITLFRNKNTNLVQVMMKEISYNQHNDIQRIHKTLQDRITYPQPNLLNIYNVSIQTDEGICGNYKVVKIYAEYLDRSLKKQLRSRRATKKYFFRQDQLWKIFRSLISAIHYLHSRKTFHGQIKFDNVMIDGDYHMKLTEKLLMGEDNWQIGLTGQSVKMLKGKDVLFSPAILRCLQHNRMQMISYDPFKGDIFSLGIIMLECSSLKKSEEFYDLNNFKVDSKKIDQTIYELRERQYSWEFVNTLQRMLEQDDQFRPTAAELYKNMKRDDGRLNVTLNQSLLMSARR